jgi:hypothetical protein
MDSKYGSPMIKDGAKGNTKLSFPCACNGCRNYPTRPAEIWHQDQIASKESETHFFSPSAMRFFSSRVADFKSVDTPSNEIKTLSVIVSSRHGYEGASRYYEIVTLCPFGTVHRESAQFESLRIARKGWDLALASFVPCSCHGCQLDRAGR